MEKIGKYQIEKELGKGATGTVYLALDPFASRRVALKLFYPEALKAAESGKVYKKLFLTESSLAGKLVHPHIAAIYDAVVDEDHSYLVMEYVEGSTLEKYCEVNSLLPLDQIVEIIYKCCKALEYAQFYGVIHRDLKPANILVSQGTDIKISDFGSAITEQAEQTTQVSGVGSLAYMSLQQVKDHPLTHQTDIYSLGVVMYKMLTGRLPFTAANSYSMIYQIINAEPALPSAYRAEIPPGLDAIVKRAMAKALEARYQTWDWFAQDLVGVFGQIEQPYQHFSDTEKFNTMKSLSFFKDFSDIELWEALRITTWDKLPPEVTLLTEGDTGDTFFILAAGEVKVTKQSKLLNVLRRGECFGEMSFLVKRQFRRTASVTTSTGVTVIEVNAEQLKIATESCRQKFNYAFLEILVDRLALANIRVSQLLAERNITV